MVVQIRTECSVDGGKIFERQSLERHYKTFEMWTNDRWSYSKFRTSSVRIILVKNSLIDYDFERAQGFLTILDKVISSDYFLSYNPDFAKVKEKYTNRI